MRKPGSIRARSDCQPLELRRRRQSIFLAPVCLALLSVVVRTQPAGAAAPQITSLLVDAPTPARRTITAEASGDGRPLTFLLDWGEKELESATIAGDPLVRSHKYRRGGLYAVSLAVCYTDEPAVCAVASEDVSIVRGNRPDSDGDAVPDNRDLCPALANPVQVDSDRDRVGDQCDNCSSTVNSDQKDDDSDGIGNACEGPSSVELPRGLTVSTPGLDPALADEPAGDRVWFYLAFNREPSSDELDGLAVAHDVRLVQVINGRAWIASALGAALAGLAADPSVLAVLPIPRGHRIGSRLQQAVDGAADGEFVSVTVRFFPDIADEAQAQSALDQVGAEPVREMSCAETYDPPYDRLICSARTTIDAARLRVSSLGPSGPVAGIDVETEPIPLLAQAVPATASDVVRGRGFNGNGVTASEWEAGGWANGETVSPPAIIPPGHVALGPRVRVRDSYPVHEAPLPPGCTDPFTINCDGAGCNFSQHATSVAGVMAGTGAGGPDNAVGYAPGIKEILAYAAGWSDNLAQLICERKDALSLGSRVGNHSYTIRPDCGVTGVYRPWSSVLDNEIRTRNQQVDVFGAGNFQGCRGCGVCYHAVCPTNCCGNGSNGCPKPPVYRGGSVSQPCVGVPQPDPSTGPYACVLRDTPPPPQPEPDSDTNNRFFTLGNGGSSAKNSVVVGAVFTEWPLAREDFTSTHFSSFGPAWDGRLLPHLVAPGARNRAIANPLGLFMPDYPSTTAYHHDMGTSFAAPGVSGTLAQLTQAANAMNLSLPSFAMKGLLIHAARDLPVHDSRGRFMKFRPLIDGSWYLTQSAPDGPDYATGYGMLNAAVALGKLGWGNPAGSIQVVGCPQRTPYAQLPVVSPFAIGAPTGPGCSSSTVSAVEYRIQVPQGTRRIWATMVYDDVGGAAQEPGLNATSSAGWAPVTSALVNDLDLTVTDERWIHYPWFLDPSCPQQAAYRPITTCSQPHKYADHRNNVEQVVVDRPRAWTWILRVNKYALPSGPQPFALWIDFS